MVKLNAAGTKVWDKTLGGNRSEYLADLIQPSYGNYLVGGWSTSGKNGDKSEFNKDTTSVLEGPADFWLVKIEEDLPTPMAWNMRYGGSGTDNLTSLIQTADGGYLAGGYTNSGISGDKTQASQGQNDFWVVKSDKNGKKLWDKRYGGSNNDFLNRVLQTQDGGYLLAGSSLSGKSGDKSEPNRGDRDFWIVKTDAQGNKEWDKTYGGSGSDELKKVIQLATGEYVLGGVTSTPASGNGNTGFWLVKISATGTKIWDKGYGGGMLGSFTQTQDGGFLLGGSTYSGNVARTDFWIVKTDAQGNEEWNKTYGGSGYDEIYSVGRSHGNNFFVAGTSTTGQEGDKSQASRSGKDYWIMKLDEKGNKIWDKTFGGNKHDELRASSFTDQGHYLLAGSSASGISGDKTQASQGESDYWVVEVDENGEKVNDKTFGGSGPDELRTVFQTNDGGLLLAGRSASGVSGDRTQPNLGSTDYWLVKVTPDSSSAVVATRVATAVAAPATLVNTLNAYPNPFHDKATISFSLPHTQMASLKIYDSQGREITTLFQGEAQAKQTYQINWQAGKQPSGLYFLQLQTPTQNQQQKVLLTK